MIGNGYHYSNGLLTYATVGSYNYILFAFTGEAWETVYARGGYTHYSISTEGECLMTLHMTSHVVEDLF